ncbi:MAG: propanediol utilization protein [Fusobacteria bacterium]|nr:MAG: propanediol utilization protein [Fusobacteriota bacterium]KAF0229929.1 MAG: propanediol utilization [Fusobacteriota bacterium]
MFVELGISARHVHLSRGDIDILFGKEYQLTVFKDLKQLGQYAANEKVEVIGPKGSFETVRILGPERKKSQVELSASDCIKIGVPVVLRDSGDHIDTPGVKLVGPKGSIELTGGVMVASRHMHVSTETADKEDIKNGELLCAKIPGDREVIFGNVLARVDATFVDELHLDTDEANASFVKNNQKVDVYKCQK